MFPGAPQAGLSVSPFPTCLVSWPIVAAGQHSFLICCSVLSSVTRTEQRLPDTHYCPFIDIWTHMGARNANLP